jgi:hypothetical protein
MKRNYRNQMGCHNCKHCFKETLDIEPEIYDYFCTKDTLPRPPCLSEVMNEAHGESETEEDDWLKWAHGKDVEPQCICDDWQLRKILFGSDGFK